MQEQLPRDLKGQSTRSLPKSRWQGIRNFSCRTTTANKWSRRASTPSPGGTTTPHYPSSPKPPRRLVEHLQLNPTDNLLDVCTGTGCVALTAAEKLTQGKVTGIDLSSGMLQQAKNKAAEQGLSNTEFQQMDLEHLDIPTRLIRRRHQQLRPVLFRRHDPGPDKHRQHRAARRQSRNNNLHRRSLLTHGRYLHQTFRIHRQGSATIVMATPGNGRINKRTVQCRRHNKSRYPPRTTGLPDDRSTNVVGCCLECWVASLVKSTVRRRAKRVWESTSKRNCWCAWRRRCLVQHRGVNCRRWKVTIAILSSRQKERS